MGKLQRRTESGLFGPHIGIAKDAGDVDEDIGSRVSTGRRCGRAVPRHEEIYCGANVGIVEGVNKVRMHLVDSVVFKDGIGVIFQADGVINVPEDIPRYHGCGVRPISGRNCISVSPVRGFIILENPREGISCNIDIAAEVKFFAT